MDDFFLNSSSIITIALVNACYFLKMICLRYAPFKKLTRLI